MINNDWRDLFNVMRISRHTETDIFPSSRVWSLFQLSLIHPLSIMHGRISPLRCTKNHSDISFLELKHQYFRDGLFVERLEGWSGSSLLLCCSFSLLKWESQSVVRTPPCSRDFLTFTWLLLSFQSDWFTVASALLLLFLFDFFFCTSIPCFPGGQNLVAAWEATSPDLFIMLPVWGRFKPVCVSLLPFFWQRTSLKSKR